MLDGQVRHNVDKRHATGAESRYRGWPTKCSCVCHYIPTIPVTNPWWDKGGLNAPALAPPPGTADLKTISSLGLICICVLACILILQYRITLYYSLTQLSTAFSIENLHCRCTTTMVVLGLIQIAGSDFFNATNERKSLGATIQLLRLWFIVKETQAVSDL